MLAKIKENEVCDLPEEFQLFDMFYVDMGVALQNQLGVLTREQEKLYGIPLWEVEKKTREKTYQQHADTVDDMRRKAKAERKQRSFAIAAYVAEGATVEEAIAKLPLPNFVAWEEK